jgi:signal transduction histidine kinase
MVEAAFLCALVGLVVRWAPEQREVAGHGAPAGPGTVAVWGAVAGAVLAGAGAATSVLRAIPTTVSAPLDPADTVLVVAVWALGPLAAAAVGLFLRYLAERRDREVAWARQAQRMELAHDLHDYVAHDVSAMVAQAQAAGVVIEDREAVRAALARIEASGLAAMASMDRAVGVLRDRSAQERGFAGVAELPELVERFGDTARLTMDPRLADAVPRELAGTVYRVVTESLTNVRRHAPAMTEVEVAVRLVAEDVEVVVRNDSVGVVPAESGRRGGVGLPALAERVSALSGTFEAGPRGGGWLVRARIPLAVGSGGTGGSYTVGVREGGER